MTEATHGPYGPYGSSCFPPHLANVVSSINKEFSTSLSIFPSSRRLGMTALASSAWVNRKGGTQSDGSEGNRTAGGLPDNP